MTWRWTTSGQKPTHPSIHKWLISSSTCRMRAIMQSKPDPETVVDGSEKPDMSIATQIAEYFRVEMEKLELRLGERIGQAVNLNATTVGRMNQLEGAFEELKQDLKQTRLDRADKEVKE